MNCPYLNLRFSPELTPLNPRKLGLLRPFRTDYSNGKIHPAAKAAGCKTYSLRETIKAFFLSSKFC
jgi:hypothetical protein